MQKINLPVDKNEANPSNPDFKWWITMVSILAWFIIFSYLVFLWFSKIILVNIDLETEKKWFWNLWNTNNQVFDYKNYSTYEIEEFKNYNIYLEEDIIVNAYAFIGWNINVTRWLLDEITNQEELIFIIAHEIGHIENRDNLKSLTTEIPMQLTLAFLWFDIWSWDYSILSIWWKAISKNTELNADIFAIELLKKYNINPLCAKQFFEADHNFADSAMEMLSSHPLNSTRIELLNTSANELWYTSINNCKTIKQ